MTPYGLGCEDEREASGARNMASYSIFIAHAPADAQITEELTRLLAETGAIVVYGADTSPTPEALDDLERAALAADAYVVLLSRASIASPRIRAVTRKYHEQRQADPLRILLPVALEPFPPDQLWPFLFEYPRIEAIPRTINEVGEQNAIAPEILALGVMHGLHLPVPARLRRVTGIPVAEPERLRRPSRPISAPITGSLVPQLQPPSRRPWRPPRALAIGGVGAALVALLVATLAFFGGATPFHLAASTNPTATFRTLIMATDTAPPAATAAPTFAPTKTAAPKRTATPAPTHTPLPTPHFYTDSEPEQASPATTISGLICKSLSRSREWMRRSISIGPTRLPIPHYPMRTTRCAGRDGCARQSPVPTRSLLFPTTVCGSISTATRIHQPSTTGTTILPRPTHSRLRSTLDSSIPSSSSFTSVVVERSRNCPGPSVAAIGSSFHRRSCTRNE